MQPRQQLPVRLLQGILLNRALEHPNAGLDALPLLHERLEATSDVVEPVGGLSEERDVLLHGRFELAVQAVQVREFGPERIGLVEGVASRLENRNGLAEVAKVDQGVVDDPVRLGLVRGKGNCPIPRVVGGVHLVFLVLEAGLLGDKGDGGGGADALVYQPEGVGVALEALVGLLQLPVERCVSGGVVIEVLKQGKGPFGLVGTEEPVGPLEFFQLDTVGLLSVGGPGRKSEQKSEDDCQEVCPPSGTRPWKQRLYHVGGGGGVRGVDPATVVEDVLERVSVPPTHD